MYHCAVFGNLFHRKVVFVSVNLCCQMEGLGGLLGLMLISCFMLIRLARLTGRLRTINDLLWGLTGGSLCEVC